MDVWDRIGISGIPETRGEYDSYIPQFYGLLRGRKSVQEIADYLISVETKMMGLAGDKNCAILAAERLIELDLA